MVLTMVAKITFPASNGRREIVLRKVSEVHIHSSISSLTDRAEIVIPRNITILKGSTIYDKYDLKKVFQSGDPVIIELGYGGDEYLYEEFRGYVVSVSADIPFVIKCEDEMWKLKQMPVNYSASNVTLEKLLTDILPGYKIDALKGVPIGGVRFPNTTVAKVLEKLQQEPFRLHSFMKGKQLVCGKYYSAYSSLKPVLFHLENNVVGNDLTYRNPEDAVKIKANSQLRNGEVIKCEMGEDGGKLLELTYYNVTDKKLLEQKVKEDYAKAKEGGLDGSITAFGIPRVVHGMKVKVESGLYKDRNGIYYVDGVSKHFVPSKYRQEITIGRKVF